MAADHPLPLGSHPPSVYDPDRSHLLNIYEDASPECPLYTAQESQTAVSSVYSQGVDDGRGLDAEKLPAKRGVGWYAAIPLSCILRLMLTRDRRGSRLFFAVAVLFLIVLVLLAVIVVLVVRDTRDEDALQRQASSRPSSPTATTVPTVSTASQAFAGKPGSFTTSTASGSSGLSTVMIPLTETHEVVTTPHETSTTQFLASPSFGSRSKVSPITTRLTSRSTNLATVHTVFDRQTYNKTRLPYGLARSLVRA